MYEPHKEPGATVVPHRLFRRSLTLPLLLCLATLLVAMQSDMLVDQRNSTLVRYATGTGLLVAEQKDETMARGRHHRFLSNHIFMSVSSR
jgi:hypothetical protein